MIKTADLAKVMNERYPEYRIYEYQDMLRIFSQIMVELALEGEVVQLHRFGTFYPFPTKPRKVFDLQTLTHKDVDGSMILKFKPARALQDKIRAEVKKEKSV